MKAVSAGNNSEGGSSTLEILIALAILTMTMSAIILVVFSNQILSADIQIRQEAIARATSSLTKARSSARQNFNATISSTSMDDIYTTNLAVTDLTPCRKHIVGRVSWATDPLRPGSTELTTDATDIPGARALGDDCPTREPTGNWSSPTMVATAPPGPPAMAVDVRNGIAFIAASGSFYIVDSRDRPHPFTTGTIDLHNNLNAVDVVGNYVYGASNAPSGQLQIIDVSDVDHPAVVASSSLPVGGSHPEATALFYYDSRVYIGTPRLIGDGAHELHIYDVSDPEHPLPISGAGVETNRNVNAIYVRGSTAYVGVSTNQGSVRDLFIYDVSDPAHVGQRSFIDLPGGGVRSLDLIGTRLYLGCFAVSGADDFFVVDVSDPARPTIIGSARIGADINAIKITGGIAFLATKKSNAEVQVWDVSDPVHPERIGAYDGSKEATALDYEDNAIWTAFDTNGSVYIISSQL